MLIENYVWNTRYWAKQIERITEEAAPLIKKLSNIPFEPLTYEEQFKLRELLMAYASYSTLLAEHAQKPVTPPRPRWKKILRIK